MFNPSNAMIDHCIQSLQVGYWQTFSKRHLEAVDEYAQLISQSAAVSLRAIASTDALYHNLEHTILVTLVGQEILRGKQLQQGNISCRDWTHFILALLCHDIGYVKGVCGLDDIEQRTYAVGKGDRTVVIAPGATAASLAPYHVDRGQQFVAETFAHQPLLDITLISQAIELTRFPVPLTESHQNTASLAGLARAADLIGQLSDPHYLEKIPALFYEFAEVGADRALGYRHPGDLRSGYPAFFHQVVLPYIEPALSLLRATQKGQQILHHLYANVHTVEQELSAIHPVCVG
jgi:hypothetical protein